MRGRMRISGTFRAAVFGANDGFVSNLALVLGVGAAGADPASLVTGMAGLSRAPCRWVRASTCPSPPSASCSPPPPVAAVGDALTRIDFDENEVALVFRARGMSEQEADSAAAAVLREREAPRLPSDDVDVETVGTPMGVAL